MSSDILLPIESGTFFFYSGCSALEPKVQDIFPLKALKAVCRFGIAVLVQRWFCKLGLIYNIASYGIKLPVGLFSSDKEQLSKEISCHLIYALIDAIGGFFTPVSVCQAIAYALFPSQVREFRDFFSVEKIFADDKPLVNNVS